VIEPAALNFFPFLRLQRCDAAMGCAYGALTSHRLQPAGAHAPSSACALLKSLAAVNLLVWNYVNDFLNHLLDTSEFTPRWNGEHFTAGHGWLHIGADAAIALACAAISVAAAWRLRKDTGTPHRTILWLLCALGLTCCAGYGLDAAMFWWPAYRLLGLVKIGAALLALLTAALLIPAIPRALALRSPIELEREIAQRRRTESELRQVHAQLEGVIELRTEELASKNAEMELFLNTVSHDLKSPVVTCLGLNGMLRDDLRAGRLAEMQDSIDRIDRSVKRMRQLIDSLLDLSRIGKVQFDIVDVDLLSLVQSIQEDLKPRMAQAGVTLVVEKELPRVRGDSQWLTEVVENLLINALKYGCDNPQPQITVGARQHDGEHHLFVRDNGRGIDPAHHSRIFEPFRRLRTEKEGSGMGLAIVARIVKMHGGKVWIESQPGHGATFWISLPSARLAAVEDAEKISQPTRSEMLSKGDRYAEAAV